jgi:hypothetical protein
MAVENSHFAIGHMCAGCPFSDKPHFGCIINGNVKVVKIPRMPNTATETVVVGDSPTSSVLPEGDSNPGE